MVFYAVMVISLATSRYFLRHHDKVSHGELIDCIKSFTDTENFRFNKSFIEYLCITLPE